MPRSGPVTPNTDEFLPEKPKRRPDGKWYACYRLRRNYGPGSETAPAVGDCFDSEAAAQRWLVDEATRLGFGA
jgi:hypothetical protein